MVTTVSTSYKPVGQLSRSAQTQINRARAAGFEVECLGYKHFIRSDGTTYTNDTASWRLWLNGVLVRDFYGLGEMRLFIDGFVLGKNSR
jgi:hypothetical protein